MPTRARHSIDRHTRTLITRAIELQSAQDLWNLDQVFTAVGIPAEDRPLRWRLRTTLTNYAVVGITTWPPTHAIRTQRMTGTGPGLRWWPPHVSVLPPPEVPDPHEPLFLSGAVRKWAMTVGRMTLDGQPITPRRGGHGEISRTAPPTPAPEFDLALWEQLTSDTTLDDVEAISRESGISLQSLYHCYRAARRLRAGAITWPPTSDDVRRGDVGPGKTIIGHWPPTPTALPPPHGVRHPDGGVTRHDSLKHRDFDQATPHSCSPVWLWERGAWRRWAMATGRMTLDGRPTVTHHQKD